MELNIRLREDLTRSFDSYIKVVQTADNLKKENSDLKLQLAKQSRSDSAEEHLLKIKLGSLNKEIQEKDEQISKLTESYERRLASIKESLEQSSESNKRLLKDLNVLQMKYL